MYFPCYCVYFQQITRDFSRAYQQFRFRYAYRPRVMKTSLALAYSINEMQWLSL